MYMYISYFNGQVLEETGFTLDIWKHGALKKCFGIKFIIQYKKIYSKSTEKKVLNDYELEFCILVPQIVQNLNNCLYSK